MKEVLTGVFPREKKEFVFSTRLTAEQMAELERAGGVNWIRAMIDARIAAIKARKARRS